MHAAAAVVGSARCVVVADASVADYARRGAELIGCDLLSAPPVCDFTQVSALGAELRSREVRVVLAVGGGTVLDVTRVAALTAAAPELGSLSGWPGQGLRRRTPPVGPQPSPPQVVAVPSTIGTGAEVSSLAVVADGSRRLRPALADQALHPAAAILDVGVLRSLPPDLVRDGLLEIAGRVLGPALADDGANPLADEVAGGILRRLIATSSRLLEVPAEDPIPDDLLTEAAWASTMSATQVASVGRSVSDSPLWLAQHAVAGLSGASKAAALRALLPVLLNRADQDHDAAPIIAADACKRIVALLRHAPSHAEESAAAQLLATFTTSGLLRGPAASIDPVASATSLIDEGFTQAGALRGLDAVSISHVLTSTPGDHPSVPNGSRYNGASSIPSSPSAAANRSS